MSDIAVATRSHQEFGKRNSELLAMRVRPSEERTENGKGWEWGVEKRWQVRCSRKRQEKDNWLNNLYLFFLLHTNNLKPWSYSTLLKCLEAFVQPGVTKSKQRRSIFIDITEVQQYLQGRSFLATWQWIRIQENAVEMSIPHQSQRVAKALKNV